jgi:dolichyl-phosphate-mannose-protein mannosyltransferase
MKRALDALIVLSAAGLFLISAIGGIELNIGELSLRAHDWRRPAVALVLGLVLRGSLARSRRSTLVDAVAHLSLCGLFALIVAAAAAYLHFHVRVAGGLDSYGYVSTAALIASGHLHEPQPLASILPFADPIRAATPLGHVPAVEGFSSVPRFPIGLPIMMAIFSVAHSSGPFFVPLVMGYLTIALVYLIGATEVAPYESISATTDALDQTGRAASNRLTGVFAAALVAVDPVFAVSAIHPMSDVPATCWLLAAIWCVDEPDQRSRPHLWNLIAGICAGMATLTRPVLLPAVMVLLLINVYRRRSPVAWTAAATACVFVVFQAWLNASLYGALTSSGYGSSSHMFELSLSRVAANASNFSKWLLYSRSTLLWLAWPAALAVLRHDRRAWELSAVAVAAGAPYLFYIVFDNWDSSRFLLPSIVLALILCARALSQILDLAQLKLRPTRVGLRMAAQTWRPAVLFAIAFACGATSQHFLQREGLGRSKVEEAKFPLVGEWFKRNTSDRAVVLSSLHSGAIRLYGKRPTIRWDEIPPDALDATIDRLTASGYEPYLALDTPSEPALYEERFRTQSAHAEPIARVRVAYIYKFTSVRQ